MFDATDAHRANFPPQKPALVLFHATWCPHCRAVYPAFNRAARTAEANGVAVFRCDVDEAAAIAKKFGATSYPTIVRVPASGGRPAVYNGDRSAADIARFAVVGST